MCGPPSSAKSRHRRARRSTQSLDGMSDVSAQITEIAQRLAPLCRHISVRNDERGPYIFAIAEDEVHSLELWHQDGKFSVELWHGRTAEVERVVETPTYPDAASAEERSSSWLRSDAI